jgi:hypothetical protein
VANHIHRESGLSTGSVVGPPSFYRPFFRLPG